MLRGRLHAFEICAAVWVVGVFGALALAGVPADPASLRRVAVGTLGVLPLSLLLGIGGQALWAFLTRTDARGYLRAALEPRWLVLWVRLWVATMATGFGYFWLKVSVPLLRSSTFDGSVLELDRVLHLGVAPVALAVRWLTEPTLLRALDYWYALWLFSLIAGIAFFASVVEPQRRRRFVLSCLLLWIGGALTYLAIPVRGPALVSAADWSALQFQMPLSAAGQRLLAGNLEAVLAGQAFDYTRGVAALPSLHVGFHALFAFWASGPWRKLRPFLIIATLLTFIGSVRTGWHYAVDGYAGVALAFAAYFLATRMDSLNKEAS